MPIVHGRRIGSATEAQAEADNLDSVWSADTALILMVVIYCAFKLEEILRAVKANYCGSGGNG